MTFNKRNAGNGRTSRALVAVPADVNANYFDRVVDKATLSAANCRETACCNHVVARLIPLSFAFESPAL